MSGDDERHDEPVSGGDVPKLRARMSELEAERDAAIAAAHAFKHAFDLRITQADVDCAIEEVRRLRPDIDFEKARKLIEEF